MLIVALSLSLLLVTSSSSSPSAAPALTAPPPSLSTVKIDKGLGPALRPIAAVFAELPGVVVTATDDGFLAVLAASENDGSNPIHVEVSGGVICPVPAPKNIMGGRAEPGFIWAHYDVRYRRLDPVSGAKSKEHSLLGESRRLQLTKEAFWAAPSTWKELRQLRDSILFPGRDDTVRALITPAFAGIADVVDATAEEAAKSPDGEVFAIVVDNKDSCVDLKTKVQSDLCFKPDGQRLVIDGAITCKDDGQHGAVIELAVRTRDLVNMRRVGSHFDTFSSSFYRCDTAISHMREKIEASLKSAVPKLAPRPPKA